MPVDSNGGVQISARATALTLALGAVATFFVAVCDRVTGADLTFTLLYAIPIGWCTWRAGSRVGFMVAVLATSCSLVNALSESSRPHLSVALWNELGILALFVALAYLVDRYRALMVHEQREKEKIVEQLRHADRLNVIGTLAAGVAHEIGTPLNVISGSAELLPEARADEVPQIARMIGDQTSRIATIIRQLLDFGRRAGANVTRVELGELLETTTNLLLATARKAAVHIVVERSQDSVFIRGNPAELQQVLSNLIINGIQAMPSGGTITLHDGVTERLNGNGKHSFGLLVVEDTGVGIASSDLPKIFDPFFTTKDVGAGTGLGLSVSYAILHDHGGSIEVESVVGRGTRFTILLPLEAEAEARHP